MRVAVHQGDEIDGDVVAGAQPVPGDPPASVLQHAPRPHDQVLGGHRVPGLKKHKKKKKKKKKREGVERTGRGAFHSSIDEQRLLRFANVC